MPTFMNREMGNAHKIMEVNTMAAITKDMGIMEIVQKYPETIRVLQAFGMGCIGCAAAHFEYLEQGATAHGIDVDAMVKAMNEVIG